jgi:hypothetical protein
MLLRKGVKEQSGHRVLFVHESGPAERAGVVPYLDVITHVDVQQLVRSGVTAGPGASGDDSSVCAACVRRALSPTWCTKNKIRHVTVPLPKGELTVPPLPVLVCLRGWGRRNICRPHTPGSH